MLSPSRAIRLFYCHPQISAGHFHSAREAPKRAVVDCGGFLPGASTRHRAASLTALANALVGPGAPGYFVAVNLDSVLPPAYIANMYAFAGALHDLPISEKLRFRAQESGKAGVSYSGSDVGKLESAYDPALTATARSWDYSPSDSALPAQGYPVLPQPWDFAREMRDLYDRQDIVANALMTAFAEALSLPSQTFADLFAGGDLGMIRLIKYPGDETDADVGIGPHTDFEAITLQHQSTHGLQLMGNGGGAGACWVAAPSKVGDFTVMIGDVMERFTNGMLRATPHRVVRRTESRMSIIRFSAVHPDVLVCPLASFVTTDTPAAYSSVTMRKHMETTRKNLERGLGSWDPERNVSTSATYVYD